MGSKIKRKEAHIVNNATRFHHIVEHQELVYLSGQLATDSTAFEQTRTILSRIDSLLAKASSCKSNILSVSIWVSDIRYFDDVNNAWREWVDQENAPVRALVESKLASPNNLVEIQVTAVKNVSKM